MKQSDALKKWKKDKPVLLTDTGVSDVLRELPDDWTQQIDISAVEAVLKKLKVMMADKKISASKSATACLTEIRADVKKDLAAVEKNRARGVEIMKEIHGVATKLHAMCESKTISLSKLKAYPGDLSKHQTEMNKLTFRARDSSAIPTKIVSAFEGAMNATVSFADQMADIVADAMSDKPKQDIKKDLPVVLKKFKTKMDDMPSAWKDLERLT